MTDNRTAFISGAGQNIGRAIALALADQGCDVVINGRSNRAICEAVAAEVEATLDGLWITHKPKIGGVGSVIPKRMNGTMSKAYEVSMRGAAAHAAAGR